MRGFAETPLHMTFHHAEETSWLAADQPRTTVDRE